MKKPYIIGIAGGSASGKSTLAKNLNELLSDEYRVRVFGMDKYFKKPEERPYNRAHVTGKMYVDNNHPLTADLPRLISDVRECSEKNECDIIIIEGLMTLWDDGVNGILDLRLFIDCRADERIVRRLRRNMASGQSFDDVAEVYLDMVRYRHDQYVEPSKWRADFIINGSNPSDTAMEALKLLVDSKMK